MPAARLPRMNAKRASAARSIRVTVASSGAELTNHWAAAALARGSAEYSAHAVDAALVPHRLR